MTEEAKRCVEAMRFKEDFECIECPIPAGYCNENCLLDVAADLIESLSAQIDAAIRDMGMTAHCLICTHHRDNGGNCCGVSMCGEHRPRWKWRGEVEE